MRWDVEGPEVSDVVDGLVLKLERGGSRRDSSGFKLAVCSCLFKAAA